SHMCCRIDGHVCLLGFGISGAANSPVCPISKRQLTANLQKNASQKFKTGHYPTLSALTRIGFFLM
ncbi:hypothetical protein, partial [Comamonas testosteroni]|uniref:hypothetical protein n=1 Tax=Comamonas testosteroni TaxID=285 RepID=UPI001EE6BAB7